MQPHILLEHKWCSIRQKENILITKQPMRFYYIGKGREDYGHVELVMPVSLCHLIMTEKFQRIVKLRAILTILQWKTIQGMS